MNASERRPIPLGPQWPTIDPFLFCAHHRDDYPVGDGELAPLASLDGRPIGSDFGGIDGWNMYHGTRVPGFPQHPHRGFETVTYVRRGWCDHSDSLGSKARFGQGDVQWLTAGRGIVHSEMFPLLATDAPNPLHLFQIWLNLDADHKMVDPYFSMLWADELPTVEPASGVSVTVIAGEVDGCSAPSPPPDSWASDPDHGVEILHATADPGSSWRLGAAGPEVERVLYLFEGDGITVGDHRVAVDHALHLDQGPVEIRAGQAGAELLILGGRPIGEPVAQHGPFVMNDRAGLEQAVRDYQATGFGGWPWPADDPVHGDRPERFASELTSPGAFDV